jgi:signal peptidase I
LEKRKEIFSWIKVFGFAIVIALIARNFIFSPYTVHGESMMPTIQNDNRVLVSKLSDIDRFDTIVFDAPDSDDRYIKRVIGLPGDTVEMKNDTLYVNGKAYSEDYLNSVAKQESISQHWTEDFTLEEKTGKKVVPEGYVFVLGDNRPISKDSRIFGLLSMKSIQGQAVFRFWPFNEIGPL